MDYSKKVESHLSKEGVVVSIYILEYQKFQLNAQKEIILHQLVNLKRTSENM